MSRPVVVVVGLGPAGPDLVTAGALDALASTSTRFLRTGRHPSAIVVEDAATFDHVYERADTFASVYEEITEALVAAAADVGEVVYAVPGSPWVLERSVRHLLDDERVEVRVVPGLSFLDLAYARVGIDPVESGVRLVDGHEFAQAAAGERGPLLVAHAHARWVLSDIKLAAEGSPSDTVVVLQRLGLPDEEVITVSWADLDRSVEPDHLTCLYIPRLAAPVGQELVRFHGIVRRLREECPWDRQQTHQSLTRYAIEEVYELVEAIGALPSAGPVGDEELEEELGDVLLQVFLHAAIAEQEGRFTVADVAESIGTKMIRRHPHVFGEAAASSAEQVAERWETIKAAEKGSARRSLVDGIPADLPSLAYAREVAARVVEGRIRLGRPRRHPGQGGRGAGGGTRLLRPAGRAAGRDRRPAVRRGQPGPAPRRGPGVGAARRHRQVPAPRRGLHGPGRCPEHRHPYGRGIRARRALDRGEGGRARLISPGAGGPTCPRPDRGARLA